MADKTPPPIFDDVDLSGTGFVPEPGKSKGSDPKGAKDPDPVAACLGEVDPAQRKAKAGYYLPVELLERFDQTWLKLRLNKEPVESKSQLVGLALELLLADLAAAEHSRVLRLLRG